MSQSPNANVPGTTRPASGQTVEVPRPEAGSQIVVRSSPGGRLDFGFDPSVDTTVTRPANSNDLVFEPDSGGRVVISDFFVVGDESLPTLRLPDGVEVASVDFFSGTGLDMTTAAGPSRAPSSGGSSYDDDAGSLIDGTDKLGTLGGTGQWATGREAREGIPELEALLPDLTPIDITGLGGARVAEAGLARGSHRPGASASSEWAVLDLPPGISVVGVPRDGSDFVFSS